MKVNLNVLERIMLSGLLPETGSYANFKLITDTRAALSFSQEEHDAINLRPHEGGGLQWDPEHSLEDKAFEFGGVVISIIVAALKKLDDEETLTEQHITLYEKFMEEARDA